MKSPILNFDDRLFLAPASVPLKYAGSMQHPMTICTLMRVYPAPIIIDLYSLSLYPFHVHVQGGLICCQLWNCGRVSHTSYQPGGKAPPAPSVVRLEEGECFTMEGPKASVVQWSQLDRQKMRVYIHTYTLSCIFYAAVGFHHFLPCVILRYPSFSPPLCLCSCPPPLPLLLIILSLVL